eukprot:208291-Hanusia_phi.AAC.2
MLLPPLRSTRAGMLGQSGQTGGFPEDGQQEGDSGGGTEGGEDGKRSRGRLHLFQLMLAAGI